MKRTTVSIKGEKISVTAHDVRTAMKQYNHEFRIKQNDSGSKYAAVDGVGKSYPPKRILGLAVKRPRTFFNGGQLTNRVFKDLGFAIRQVDGLSVADDKRSELEPNLDADVPKIDVLVKALLKEKWAILIGPNSPTPQWSSIKDWKHAGVYVLARPLTGKRVKPRDVDYVGMTHAGLKSRLKQFTDGIQRNCCHSGARTFFHSKSFAKGRAYSQIPRSRRHTFFVATILVPCIVSKLRRSPLDLRKMGAVSELELYVLAHIKEITGGEPHLNKH